MVPVAVRPPGHVGSIAPLTGFRARCERCGWLGRPQSTPPGALRTAKGHTCLPVAGAVALPVSGWLQNPWVVSSPSVEGENQQGVGTDPMARTPLPKGGGIPARSSTEPRSEESGVRLTVSRRLGDAGQRAILRILDEWVLLGDLNADEIQNLQRLVRGNLHLWDMSLEVWVPTPSLLLRLSQAGLPDLSTSRGFRQLAEFRPLATPALEDPWLWRKTTLGSATREGLVFGVRKEGNDIYWLLPLEDRAFFKLRPAALTAVDPGLFGALGIDRLLQFLRATPGWGP